MTASTPAPVPHGLAVRRACVECGQPVAVRTSGPAAEPVCSTCGASQRPQDRAPTPTKPTPSANRRRLGARAVVLLVVLAAAGVAAYATRVDDERKPSVREARSHAGLRAGTLSWSARVGRVVGRDAKVAEGADCEIAADVWTDGTRLVDAQVRFRCAGREIYRGSFDDALECALYEHETPTPDRYTYDFVCHHPDPPTSQVFRMTMRTWHGRAQVISRWPRHRVNLTFERSAGTRTGPRLLDAKR